MTRCSSSAFSSQLRFDALALADLALEIAIRLLERLSPALDLREHAVERVGEQTDLVVGGLLGSAREVALLHDVAGHRGDGHDRPRDALLQPPGDQRSRQQAERHHAADDAEIAEQPREHSVAGFDVDRAEDLVARDDALEKPDVAIFDAIAVEGR